jgi:hypothetical protein
VKAAGLVLGNTVNAKEEKNLLGGGANETS